MNNTHQALTVRVAIPHYFAEDSSSTLYGSSRIGNKRKRELALYNCISSILAQSSTYSSLYLDLAREKVITISSSLCDAFPNLSTDVHVFVCKNNFLPDVLATFSSLITIHQVDIENPRELPLYASNWLINHSLPCDLNYFSEDDIVLHDSQFFSKQDLFLRSTKFKFVLMPHRYELMYSSFPQKLYVDGPNSLCQDEEGYKELSQILATPVVEAKFPGFDSVITFVRASNPHSGTFTVRREQLNNLCDVTRDEMNYISPLESASSGLVRAKYIVLKPSWQHASFLEVCHDNSSFLVYINRWD